MEFYMKALKLKDNDTYYIPYAGLENLHVSHTADHTGKETFGLSIQNDMDPREDLHGFVELLLDKEMAIKAAVLLLRAVFDEFEEE